VADKVRLGFVGLGVMGRDLLTQARQHPDAEIAAICDGNPASLAKAQECCVSEPARYDDYRKLLASEQLDGVVVAAPQFLHAPVTIAALGAGVHVFCEKPMALNAAEAKAMIAAAERNGRELMIGQVLQYLNVYRLILERIRSGEFGRPVAMRTIRTMGKWGGIWEQDWRLKRAQCAGTLAEVNVHEIDLMLRIMGPADTVSAIGGNYVTSEIDYEDFVMANITFRNGGAGSITSAQCDYLGKNSGEIFLEKGTIYYESVSQRAQFMAEGGEKEDIAYADIHPEWENGIYREMREFIETCRGDHPSPIPGEDGLRALEIAEAAYRSIEEKQPVILPL
jgi:UDP-N-acetylglucosamine 3-dehydrogenase